MTGSTLSYVPEEGRRSWDPSALQVPSKVVGAGVGCGTTTLLFYMVALFLCSSAMLTCMTCVKLIAENTLFLAFAARLLENLVI